MAFKSDESITVNSEQANEFFNDDVSVSLFSELAKDTSENKTKEVSSDIPNTISDSIEDNENIQPEDKKIKTPIEKSNVIETKEINKTSLELPKEWQEALEKEFNSENPSLIGWEDDKGNTIVPKTFDELKELINENKKHEVEENKKKWESESLNDLSPQVKSILEYAKSGGKDVTPLLEAWGTVESIGQLDPTNVLDAEEIVRYSLEQKGLEKDDIDEQIEFFKTTNKLVLKATDLKPKLEEQEIARIAQMEQEQKQRQLELQANKVKYQTNMSKAIEEVFTDKGIVSTIKHSIFEPTYESSFRPGLKVTGFQRGLEDLQLDPTKNKHFAEVALLVSDRETFFETYAKEIKKEITADTVKKLKYSKNTISTTEEEINLNQPKKLRGFRPTWKD